MEGYLAIGDVAARVGIAVSAIRFYEERDLIRPVRDSNGRRYFQRSDIRRLSFILAAQRLGFTLTRIGEELSRLPESRTPTARDWEKVSTAMHAEIDEKIRELTRMRDNLSGCIGCGCLSLKKCRLLNPGDRLGNIGTGPRIILDGRSGTG